MNESQNAPSRDSFAPRRAFLKQMGLSAKIIRTNRLRESDGLSEDAWWAVVKRVLEGKKNANFA